MERAMPFVSAVLVVLAFFVGRLTTGGKSTENYADYYVRAAQLYDQATQLDSPPADANDPERWAQVLALYRAVFDGYPDSPYADDALYAIASRIDIEDQPDTAFALYRRLIDRYPDSEHAPEALNAIGVALFQREEYDRAVVLFDQFLQNYPSSPLREKVALNHAISQYKRGKYDVALDELRQFTEDFPMTDQIAATIFYSGMIYYEKQQYGEARTRFLNIVDLADPEFSPAAQFNIGQTYFDERNYEDAIAAYRQTVELYPDTKYAEEATFRIGWALERQKKYAEAVTALKDAIEKYRTSKNAVAAQVFLARIDLEGLDDPESAVAAYRAIVDGTIPLDSIETDQRSAYDVRRNAQYQIGKIYEDRGEYDKAIAEYQTLIDEYPEPHSIPNHPSNEIDEAYLLDLRARKSS